MKKSTLLLTILTMCIIISCTKSHLDNLSPSSYKRIPIKVSFSVGSPQTRAIYADNDPYKIEEQLDNVWVVAVNGDDLYKSVLTKIGENYQAMLPSDVVSENNTKLYFIANANLIENFNSITTLSGLLSATHTKTIKTGESERYVMATKEKCLFTISDGLITIDKEVTLSPTVARIKFEHPNILTEIEEIEIKGTLKKGTLQGFLDSPMLSASSEDYAITESSFNAGKTGVGYCYVYPSEGERVSITVKIKNDHRTTYIDRIENGASYSVIVLYGASLVYTDNGIVSYEKASSTFIFPSSANSLEISFEDGTTSEIQQEGSWLTIENVEKGTTKGISLSEKIIKCEPNTTSTSRSATITLRNRSAVEVFNINQAGYSASSCPVVDIMITEEVGIYSKADSTLFITNGGGQIIFDAQANAECGIEIQGDWISLEAQTKSGSVIASRFNVNTTENTTESERSATIRIFNKTNNSSNKFTVTQSGIPIVKDNKYMVLVVAGQSNAVGYDQSPIDAIDLTTSDRAWQLSYRRGNPDANVSIIPLTWCADDIDAQKDNRKNESGQFGMKGIHLPLAKELLRYVPSDYKIVVIPVAYASSAFASSGYGTYNQLLMRPNEMTTVLRWGTQSAYASTIIERTKRVLNMSPKNKFLGIVWCQGEANYANSDFHYTEFTKMAESILSQINISHGNRSNYGAIDKRSWYNFSSCNKWVNWYSASDASAVFGGYKVWNPDTFIHVPSDYPINPPIGAGGGDNHFGKNAYRDIAKLVAERMNMNGLLFNGVTPASNHFRDKTTLNEANLIGGNLNDADVAGSLVLMMPFENSTVENKTAIASVSSSGVSISQAQGMVDINGNPRVRNALSLSRTGGSVRVKLLPQMTDWSISFMLKRTSNLNTNLQTIIPPINNSAPFIGFKKFGSNGVAGTTEFIVEPVKTTIKANAVPGMFMAADRVNSLTEWIHYTITYNNTTKETCIYMNGDIVQKSEIALEITPSFDGSINIGNSDVNYPSVDGQIADLYIWSKTISISTIKKVFLMSYYGFTK